jgi:hypothetical protein
MKDELAKSIDNVLLAAEFWADYLSDQHRAEELTILEKSLTDVGTARRNGIIP